MTVKDWISKFYKFNNGTIKVYDDRRKKYLSSGYSDLIVKKVIRYKGYGFNQINTCLHVYSKN